MWDDDSSREVISPDVLPRWSRGVAADALGDDPLTAPAGRVPFAINSAMNRKVVFTRAPACSIRCSHARQPCARQPCGAIMQSVQRAAGNQPCAATS